MITPQFLKSARNARPCIKCGGLKHDHVHGVCACDSCQGARCEYDWVIVDAKQ